MCYMHNNLFSASNLLSIQEGVEDTSVQNVNVYSNASHQASFSTGESLNIYLKALDTIQNKTKLLMDSLKQDKRGEATIIYLDVKKIVDTFSRGFSICYSGASLELCTTMCKTSLHIAQCIDSAYVMKDPQQHEEAIIYVEKMRALIKQMVDINANYVYIDDDDSNIQAV